MVEDIRRLKGADRINKNGKCFQLVRRDSHANVRTYTQPNHRIMRRNISLIQKL